MERKEQMVWQRVGAGPQPVRDLEDIRELLREAAEREAIYRSLAERLPAGEGLLKEQRETVACLLGMGKLGGRNMTRPWSPGLKYAPEKLLMLAYPKSLAAVREYTARSAEPRFGAVFRLLAQREEGQCLRILTLLGGRTGG